MNVNSNGRSSRQPRRQAVKRLVDLSNYEFRFEVKVIPTKAQGGKTLAVGRDPYKANTLVGEFIRTARKIDDSRPFFSGHNESFEMRVDGKWERASFIKFQEEMVKNYLGVSSATYAQMVDHIVEGRNKGQLDPRLSGREDLFKSNITAQLHDAVIEGVKVPFDDSNFDGLNPKKFGSINKYLSSYYIYFNDLRPEPVYDQAYKVFNIIVADAVVELIFEEMGQMKDMLRGVRGTSVSTPPTTSSRKSKIRLLSFNDLSDTQKVSDAIKATALDIPASNAPASDSLFE